MAANSSLPVVDEQRIPGEGTAPKPPTRSEIGMEERPVLLSNKKGPFSERVRKGLFILVVIVATVIISIVVYKLTSSDQQENFEGRYNDYAKQVVKSFQDDFERVVTALIALSVEITSYAIDSKSTFPFVTVSNFEARGRSVLDLAQGLLVCYAPKVTDDNKAEFTYNYVVNNSGWIQESRNYQPIFNQDVRRLGFTNSAPPPIWEYSPIDGSNAQDTGPGPFAPIWQLAPVPATPQYPLPLMFNEKSDTSLNQAINASELVRGAAATPIVFPRRELVANLAYVGLPMTYVVVPVFTNFTASREVAGYLSMQLLWEKFLKQYLDTGAKGVVCVLETSCGEAYTYQLFPDKIEFLGEGDQHDPSFDSLQTTTPLLLGVPSACGYYLRVYPSAAYQSEFVNKKPVVYAVIVSVVAAFLLGVFLIYDYMEMRRRKEELKATVTVMETESTPLSQRDTPFTQVASSDSSNNTGQDFQARSPDEEVPAIQGMTPKVRIKRYLEINATAQFPSEGETLDGKPIADLFPKTTVMFADIAGFTAWSSEREPSHVFLLLETIYHAFDQLAKRHGVFKVETVRDCYVAVTGVPEPQQDHAIVMAKFACDCMKRMKQLTRRLEVMLGPDTGDLTMRLGIHSGPVTAGVLRGERSRFQLFGDTVHIAERLESTGERGKIQISQDTADLLIAGGMSGMIQGRRELVRTPGKGDMKTFWLNVKVDGLEALEDVDLEPLSIWPKRLPSLDMRKEKMKAMGKPSKTPPHAKKNEKGGTIAMIDERRRRLDPEGRQDWGDATLDSRVQDTITQYDKIQRLVDWNVDLLYGHLKAIVANRIAAGNPPQCVKGLEHNIRKDMTVLDEVTEMITLPQFNPNAVASQVDPSAVELEKEVVVQLRDYVTVIASMYRPNPFHNFEHASHVTMSVNKLLARIVTPEIGDGALSSPSGIASHRHEYTYGITSDPLTQFAVVFSALIHDVDHPGVSNFQLIKEEAFIATLYRNKSVAEQNSVDLAWDLLMDDSYDALRRCIYATEAELQRFRQVVVNVVLATDIFDQELKALRNNRWDRAFHQRLAASHNESSDDPNRKATIVIEHIIQASDVAHTMQHWHVYSKWNERLFQEMYANYCSGRSDKNPADGWYFGEISFFDNYIIPLAEKLKECGVFGVSCDEYLNYAVKNRQEWAVKGENMVREFEEKCENVAVDQYRAQLS